jgi:hypothetical protein
MTAAAKSNTMAMFKVRFQVQQFQEAIFPARVCGIRKARGASTAALNSTIAGFRFLRGVHRGESR